MNLLLDLLVGAGKFRYLSTNSVEVEQVEVTVHGFSAGSYSGLCLMHLLWNLPHVRTSGKLGGIALPPSLLHSIPTHQGKVVTREAMKTLFPKRKT